MAAKATVLSGHMVLKIVTGVTPKGEDVITSKKFAIKTAATEQDIFDTAAAFEPVLDKPLNEIEKIVTSGITSV